jgi:hypothetical protein
MNWINSESLWLILLKFSQTYQTVLQIQVLVHSNKPNKKSSNRDHMDSNFIGHNIFSAHLDTSLFNTFSTSTLVH